jgi:manganese efflux pump family protein
LAGKLIALILPLGLDTFAVAAALGAMGAEQRLRISALLSSFEAGMPLIGLALGAPLGRAIGGAADFVAIGVLLSFGLYTLLGSERAEDQQLARFASVRGPAALLLGLTVSLDELAIGFTLGLLRVPVVLVIALIAAQAFVLAQLGLRLGGRLSTRFREGAERLAGVALAGLAVALLVQKLV